MINSTLKCIQNAVIQENTLYNNAVAATFGPPKTTTGGE